MFRYIFCLVIISCCSKSICGEQNLVAVDKVNNTSRVQVDNRTKSSTEEGVLRVARNIIINVRAFADVVEKNLPKEIHEEKLNKSEVATKINLVIGVRHFVLGLKQISSAFEKLFFEENVTEKRQLSEATIYTTEVFAGISDKLQTLRLLVGQAITSYNFYIPELMVSKCFAEYMTVEYPEKALYEYPTQMLADLYELVMTRYGAGNATDTHTTEMHPVSNSKLNEGSSEDPTIIAFTPRPNDSENEIEKGARSLQEKDPSIFDFDEVMESTMGMGTEVVKVKRKMTWRKCVQIYVLEVFIRVVLGYFYHV